MDILKTRQGWHGPLSALIATGWALPTWAVNDLPGGPAVNQLDLHPPASKMAADIITLHNGMLIVCLVIFIAVFGVMFYSIFKHRKSKGHPAANFHESVAVEIAWTVVPFLIVIGMGVAATKTVVAQKDTSNADLTIKATGYQWKWGYDYIKGEGEGINFLSTLDVTHREMSDSGHPQGDDYLLKVDNPLVLPVNKKVRIITTANDVIHAWMVPAFAVRRPLFSWSKSRATRPPPASPAGSRARSGPSVDPSWTTSYCPRGLRSTARIPIGVPV